MQAEGSPKGCEEPAKTSILQRKPYLTSPARKDTVLHHRWHMKQNQRNLELVLNENYKRTQVTLPPKLKQTVPKIASAVKPITLKDMDLTEDQIYENRVLNLTIIDELNWYYPSLKIIAEDENGDAARVNMYNFEKDKATLAKFQPGCRIAILNPYMRIGLADNTHGVRVDEPKCVIFLHKKENVCRFCGEENAPRKCSKCRQPYCSEECQKLDWYELKHKLICSLKSS